jgi:hypothetical protein
LTAGGDVLAVLSRKYEEGNSSAGRFSRGLNIQGASGKKNTSVVGRL